MLNPATFPFPFSSPPLTLSLSSLEERGKGVHKASLGLSVAVTEADTCRKYIVPKLVAAGWENEPHVRESFEHEGAEETEIILGCPRRGRADRLKRERQDFFEKFGPEARAVLNDLLGKYTEQGATQLQFPDALRVPPVLNRGSVSEIANYFGGPEQLRSAVKQLQTLLYAA